MGLRSLIGVFVEKKIVEKIVKKSEKKAKAPQGTPKFDPFGGQEFGWPSNPRSGFKRKNFIKQWRG